MFKIILLLLALLSCVMFGICILYRRKLSAAHDCWAKLLDFRLAQHVVLEKVCNVLSVTDVSCDVRGLVLGLRQILSDSFSKNLCMFSAKKFFMIEQSIDMQILRLQQLIGQEGKFIERAKIHQLLQEYRIIVETSLPVRNRFNILLNDIKLVLPRRLSNFVYKRLAL